MPPSHFLTLTALLSLLHLSHAAYKFDLINIKSGENIGRMYSVATKSPITMQLRQNNTLNTPVAALFTLLEQFRNVSLHRFSALDPLACNLDRTNNAWIRGSKKKIMARQIGELTDQCPGQIDLDQAVRNNDFTPSQAAQIPNILRNGLEAIYQASLADQTYFPPENWTKGSFRMHDFLRPVDAQECHLYPLFAYRVDGQWFIEAAITNHLKDVYVEDYQRQIIREYIPETGNVALRMPHVRLSDNEFENSTNILTRWGGRPAMSSGGGINFFSRRGPIGQAYRPNLVAVDLAEDSLTVSNIAILALPMAMNLIPVALIAQVNTWATIMYLIFTDIFSTVPFAIKGFELIFTERRLEEKVVSYFLGDENTSQTEMFLVACRPTSTYRNVGIAFVVIAFLAMILGVSLELYAKRVMKRRKGQDGPFGPMVDAIQYGTLGALGEKEKIRRFAYNALEDEHAIVRGMGRPVEDEHEDDGHPSLSSSIFTASALSQRSLASASSRRSKQE